MKYQPRARMARRPRLPLLAAAGLLALSAPALAQDGGTDAAGGDAGTPPAVCDPTTLLCSSTLVKQAMDSHDSLPINIDTGWVPKCNPSPPDHCSSQKIQVNAKVTFDPSGASPIYAVDMQKGANIQVTWPDTSGFVVSLEHDPKPDAQFRITHTLTPSFGLYFNTSIYTGEIDIDANTLINYLPGAQFDYVALGSGNFNPWGFDGVDVGVKGTNLNSSKLFSVTFDQLGKLVGTGNFNNIITGDFSFDATTDTTFTYTTTSVKPIGGTGAITQQDGTAVFPMLDQDYLEFTLQTQGEITYTGNIELLPVININSIAGIGITLNFPISVGLKFPVTGNPIPVNFPTQIVHLPLPNVFVPTTPVDFGQVDTGNRKDKTVSIDNTGELGALLQFSSSDPQFSPAVQSTQMGPADTYDLGVRFKPTKGGAQKATITVTSNDPDSPDQEFTVMGYGRGPDLPSPDGGSNTDGGSASATPAQSGDTGGCGCRAAGGGPGEPASLLALLGLAGVALLRRRRD